MNLLIILIGLALFHFITGLGILNLFGIRQRLLPRIALSVILGILVASVVPFLLQLFYIPVSSGNIFLTWAIFALLLNIKTLINLKKNPPKWTRFTFGLKLHELPAILLIGFMLFVSAWRCYYYPQYTRDGNSGPEPIAAYALKEHTLINSVFSVDLGTTNNQYKSPFLTDLQLIYKYAGFPFGSMWLPLLVLSFFIFLYYVLSEKVHPVIAGILLVFFLFTPEAYAYTFVCLYDYSNMVLLFLGFYYLFSYFKSRQRNQFYLSALLMFFAVYVRSETLVLVFMAMPLVLYSAYKAKENLPKALGHIVIFMVICGLGYLIPTEIYNNHYLPQTYQVDSLMNKDLSNIQPFFNRLSYMTLELMLGNRGRMLWAYFMDIFVLIFLIELIFKRKFTKEAGNWLLAVLVIYIGLPFLGYLFPLMDLDNSTKRGLFKILPLMLLYMGNNQVLTRLSDRIKKWEQA